MAKIFVNEFLSQIGEALVKDPKAKELAYAEAKGILSERVEQLIQDFDSHPVTAELDEGPAASSKYVAGNLFSYIGFYKGKSPTDPIRKIFKNNSRVLRRAAFDKKTFGYIVECNLPTPTDVFEKTPYPNWDGGISWARDFESKGISGINAYVYKYNEDLKSRLYKYFNKSRSSTGIQSAKIARIFRYNSGQKPPQGSYITYLLFKFRSQFKVRGKFT